MDSIWEYRNLLLAGTAVTVQLALASLALSVVLGLVGAAAKLAARWLPSWVGWNTSQVKLTFGLALYYEDVFSRASERLIGPQRSS